MSVAFCFALCGVTFAQGASAVRLVEDDLGTVAPTQATSLADLSLPDDVSPGERVTMTIRDVDLRDALQVFGEWTGRSIVVSAQIEGTIGLLQLVDERAENVLDAILENPEYDLAYNTTAKGVTYIYPANAERPAGAEPHTGSTGGIVPTGVDVIRGGVSSVSSAGPKALGPGLEALEGGGEPALPPAEKPMLFESIQLKYASATTVAELFGGRVIAAGGYGLGPEYANAQSQAVRNMSRMDAGYGNRNAVVGGGYGTQQFGGGGFGGGGNFGGGGFGGRGGGFGGGGNFGGGGFGGRGGGFGGGGMGGYGGGGMGGYGGGGFGGGGMGGMGGLPIPEDVQSVTGVVEHNAIIVYGAQEGIDQLRELIALLDRPPKQVAIEMIIADVSMSMAKSKYLRWAVTDGLFEVGLTPDGTQAGSLAVGFASGDLRAALYANEANSGIDVLAMPRVITMNNTMAMIAQQREVPIIVPQLTRDQFGNVMQGQTIEDSVSHGIMMTVTPRINEDNSVTMYVSPQVNLPGETWVVDGVPYPTEEERYIEALVTVPDGKTVVLGGLINKTKLISRGRIPILSDIPVLGSLFRTRSSSYTEKELLFFITVTVIPPTDIDVKL